METTGEPKRKRRKREHKRWQQFLLDLQVDEGNVNPGLNVTKLATLKRYDMLSDVDAGLARMKQVIDEHQRKDATDLSGDGSEELVLGLFYLEGVLVERDESRGAELLQAAVARGNLGAMQSLGNFLIDQRHAQQPDAPQVISLPEDANAVELFRLAAEGGQTEAQFQMGLLLEELEEIQDLKKAEFYYQAASIHGHPIAPFRLGMMYINDELDEGEKTMEQVVDLLRLAAQRKCLDANVQLARIYFKDPVGGVVTKEEAAKLIESAAEVGHPTAQFMLVNGYELGLWGDQVNLTVEQRWKLYKTAAKKGNADGQNKTGEIYWRGELGVEKDYVKACKFFQKAVDQDHTEAQVNLGKAYRKGRGIEKDPAKAAEMFHLAAGEEGGDLAIRLLGELYERGEGVEKNADEASRFYEQARALHVEGATERLEALHRRGEGWQGLTLEMVQHYHNLVRTFKGEWLNDRDVEALKIFDSHKVVLCPFFFPLIRLSFLADAVRAESGCTRVGCYTRSRRKRKRKRMLYGWLDERIRLLPTQGFGPRSNGVQKGCRRRQYFGSNGSRSLVP